MNAKDATAPAARSWEPPSEFDEYRLVRSIGRGRTGKVYLAHDTLLDRAVAVKFIPAQDSVWLSRFLLEARAAARVQHPNVVTLYRVGQVDDQAYLVSEYIRGQSLDRLPRPVEWRRVLEIAVDLARGLSAAHRCGVLHRDLKPGNAVLAETGEVKLLDFGLAKLTDEPPALKAEVSAEPIKLDQSASLTGNLVGTPYFMAPEIWRGEEATPRSDLFSLGIVLYELCAGRGPFRDVRPSELPDVVPVRDAKPLAEAVPGIDSRFAAAVDRCLRRDPSRRFQSADALVDELEGLRPSTSAAPPDGNPYRGLLAFEAEHRSLFFGRRREVRAAIDRLRADSFVLLTGDSGVGKSSLCQAGLVPAVLDGALLEGRSWEAVRLVPGRRPLAALAGAVGRVLQKNELEAEEALRTAPQDVVRALRQKLGAGQGLLVYVDQLEELLTLSEPGQADAAARVLAQLALGYGGLKLLASARSDFLSRLARLPELGELVPRSLYLVRGLNEEETREAIVGPALLKGARFESEALVDLLVRSAKAADGGLPILQFALAELWANRQQNVLTQGALEAMGGVEGALARHADGVVEHLLPAQRPIARRLLMRLVTVEGTRSRRTLLELGAEKADVHAVVEAMVAGRLLVARDAEGSSTVELAHEALVSHWGTLARWLAEESDARAARQRLETAAGDWIRHGRAKDSLWRTWQLKELALLDQESFQPDEREFVNASRAAVRRATLLRRVLGAGFAVSLFAVYLGVHWSYRARAESKLEAQIAQAEKGRAHALALREQLDSARALAFATFDREDRAGGERAWSTARTLQREAEEAYQDAAGEFEAAQVLAPASVPVRDRLASFLADRIGFLESISRTAVAQELRGRLRRLDPERFAALDRPGRLEVQAAPGLALTIAAYGPPPARVLGPARPLEAGRPESLGAGAYLVTASANGQTVQAPVNVGPGEAKTVSLALPMGAIPSGFVYVPEGRFLFGTGADESVREFFNAVPVHPLEQPAFLIAREEATYADWIAFLDALPADQREAHRPHVGATGLSGDLDLAQVGGHWQLSLAVGNHHYLLHDGDTWQLPGRAKAVDWHSLPVAGISYADAKAYAAWLSASGRVKGARLCTEREWERAARGADAREYPMGDVLTPDLANYDLTYGKRAEAFGPDAVGSHPQSRSPFGVDDLVGNVWEWVDSSLTEGEAVARGGSYYTNGNSCRAINRETPEKGFRAGILGTRVCADPPPSAR